MWDIMLGQPLGHFVSFGLIRYALRDVVRHTKTRHEAAVMFAWQLLTAIAIPRFHSLG